MKKADEMELTNVQGGADMDDASKVRSMDYIFKVGDRVTAIWNPENGVGTVIEHVGVSGTYFIDKVHFPNINQTVDIFESNLYPAD